MLNKFKQIVQDKVVKKTDSSNLEENGDENNKDKPKIKSNEKEAKLKLLVQSMAAQKQLKNTDTLFSPDSQLTPKIEEDKNQDGKSKGLEDIDEDEVEYEQSILSIYNTNLNHPVSCLLVEDFYKVIELAFIIDATESMTPFIEVVCEYIFSSVTAIRLQHRNKIVRVAVITYKDNSELINKIEILQFTESTKEMRDFLYDLMLQGGDDICEDLNGGLQIVQNLKWSNEISKKYLFQFGDSPCHNKKYNGGFIQDNYPDGLEKDQVFEALFFKFQILYINYVIVEITQKTQYMNMIFNYIWLQTQDKLFVDQYSNNKIFSKYFQQNKLFSNSIRFQGLSETPITKKKKDQPNTDDIDKQFSQLNPQLRNSIKILINNIYQLYKDQEAKVQEEKLKNLEKQSNPASQKNIETAVKGILKGSIEKQITKESSSSQANTKDLLLLALNKQKIK